MDYKQMLHKLIDSLDDKKIKHIYYYVLGIMGRTF